MPELLDLVEAGEEVVITRDGKPFARLVRDNALAGKRAGSWVGSMKGKIWYADDIEAPLDQEDARLWYESTLFPDERKPE